MALLTARLITATASRYVEQRHTALTLAKSSDTILNECSSDQTDVLHEDGGNFNDRTLECLFWFVLRRFSQRCHFQTSDYRLKEDLQHFETAATSSLLVCLCVCLFVCLFVSYTNSHSCSFLSSFPSLSCADTDSDSVPTDTDTQ
jgi:hypothetical protein